MAATSAFHDANEREFVTGPASHVAVTENQYRPGTLGTELMAVCQREGHARVFTRSKHSAAMIDTILSCPVKEQTPRGAVPYRSVNPRRTQSGGRLVQDASKSQPRVEFIGGKGTKLAWEDDTVLLPFNNDDEQPLLGDLPDGVFTARQADAGDDGWVIEDGSGTDVARAATEDALDEEYTAVWDWFQPDRITFQPDVTIYYPDPENGEDLVTYRKHSPVNHEPASATMFLKQTTVSSEGDDLPTAELFERYVAWQAGFEGEPAGRPTFGTHLPEYGDIKRIADGEDAPSRVLSDRVWRWDPVVSRQT